jgi:hypothetical protein
MVLIIGWFVAPGLGVLDLPLDLAGVPRPGWDDPSDH